jgi:hypothetical protein
MVKKRYKTAYNFLFFLTLTVMSNKCHFVFLNGNIFIYFYSDREFFSEFNYVYTLTFVK